MKSARLNRLFNPRSRRCLDVAIDHGFFNELSFLSGIEDIRRTIDVLVEANPDSVQLTIGQARLLQCTEKPIKPGAAGIVYGRTIIQHPRPAKITRALMAVVHDDVSAADALNLLSESP